MAFTITTYLNPILPNNFGFMAHDENGNYGFGRTAAEAWDKYWNLLDVEVDLQPDGYYKAIDRNTYDCDCDQDGFFEVCAVGHGRTPLDAIADLLDNLEAA